MKRLGNKNNFSFINFFKNLFQKEFFINWLVFTLIFTVYFSSAVGLMNSLDTPQYFTTEAIIRNNDLDMSFFANHPRYFIWPDYFQHNGRILNFRGYLLSFFSIPFHVFSYYFNSFLKINNFPKNILYDQFKYELTIVSFFTIFSVLGLIILWRLLFEITNNKKIATIIIFLLAFGSYIWKYSSLYSRHGFIIFLLSLIIYCFYKYLILEKINKKKSFILFSMFILLGIIAYGIDLVITINFFIFLFFYIIYYLFNKNKKYLKAFFLTFIPGVLLFLILIFINIYYYGDIFTFHNNKEQRILSILKEKTNQAWISTPLFPTVFVILFNLKKIPSESFYNFNFYPKELAKLNGVEYAKKYNFFGIFAISPFLLFSLFLLIYYRNYKKYKFLIIFSIWMFLSNIIANSKILNFWGGNQYDVRYFYPYIIFLTIPLAFSIKKIFSIKNIFLKLLLLISFVISGLWSLLMGWLGVINMYKPALTGERRIWMDIYDLPSQFFNHSFKEYLDATFMNRENFWIPIIFSFLVFFIYEISKFLFRLLINKDSFSQNQK